MSLTTRILSAIDSDPIILSHHPMCGKFDDHMFRVRGRQVCIGCTTVYPSAVLTLLALALMNLGSFSFAFPLAVTTFGANMPRLLIKDHRLSVFFNVFLGVSLGASLMSAVHAPANIQLGVIVVGLVVASFFTYIKGIRVLTTCRRCPRYSEFPGCHKPEAPSADG